MRPSPSSTFRGVVATVATLAVTTGIALPASRAMTVHVDPVEPAEVSAAHGAGPPLPDTPTIVLVQDGSQGSTDVDLLRPQGYDVQDVRDIRAFRGIRSINGASARFSGEDVATYVRTIPGPVILVGGPDLGPVIEYAASHVSNVEALVYVDSVGESGGTASTTQDSGPRRTPYFSHITLVSHP